MKGNFQHRLTRESGIYRLLHSVWCIINTCTSLIVRVNLLVIETLLAAESPLGCMLLSVGNLRPGSLALANPTLSRSVMAQHEGIPSDREGMTSKGKLL